MRKYKEVAMKNKLRRKLTALALCGVMIFSGSSSALADSQAGENDENQIVQEQVLDEVIEEADTEVQEPAVEEATQELVPETVEPVIEEAPVEEVVEEVVEEQPQVEIQEVEAQPTVVEQVVEAVSTATEKVVEVVETVIRYIIGIHDDLTYEDDQVIIKVYAEQDEIIPEGTKIKVVPILADDEATKAQYEEVAAGLQEKAAADEQIIEGFLAYDITLVDPEGNEFEPNGEVKVTMDYKKAALPAEVENVEEAEVTIHHFEEDANGEVKQIVDMVAEAAIEAAVEVTEAAEVEKAEFVTTSFSTYTITWRVSNTNRQLIAQVVDTNGNAIPGASDITISGTLGNDEEYNFADKCESLEVNGKTFAFKEAVYTTGSFANGRTIETVRYSTNKFQYGTSNGWYTSWTDFGSNYTVYLVYDEVEPLTTIQTVDHESDGIIMRLIDYTKGQNNLYNFGNNAGWSNGAIRPNILKRTLTDGYPVLASGDRVSLKPIFSGEEGTNIRSAYTVNHLFSKDIYDSTGYYEYSSFENYAYLNRDTSDFTVYEQIGTPYGGSSSDYLYQRGNFFPFNNIEAGKLSGKYNRYDDKGVRLEEGDYRYNEPLYETQADETYTGTGTTGNNPNFYFGMYMEATFVQPKDGLVEWNGSSSPMRYEFNGDDDLWIFVDEALMLDIGGIHVAHEGYIDFSTGEIGWYDGANNATQTLYKSSIKAMFEAAGIFPDGTKWSNDVDKQKEYFRGNTFVDYSGHTLKMFYMERGDGASDLHVRFNIPAIPKGTFEVTKELTNTDKEQYANVDFAFQAFAQEIASTDANGVETYNDVYVPLLPTDDISIKYKDTNKDIVFDHDQTFNGKEYDNVFYLKHGETATFSGLQENRKYYIVEVGVNAQEFDKVVINGVGHKEFNEDDQETGIIQDVKTSEMAVSKRPLVLYENNCSSYNLRELKITKVMKQGQNANVNDTFTFKVLLENADGQLVPYVGPYYLQDATGNYYTYNAGTLVQAASATVCGNTTNEGLITGVKVGYTASITQILSGTDFVVTEDLDSLDTTIYDSPEVSVAKDTVDDAQIKDSLGSIKLGTNALVTVTNTLKKIVTIQKVWDDVENTFGTRPGSLEVTIKNQTDETDIGTISLKPINQASSDNKLEVGDQELRVEYTDWGATIYGLSTDDYEITEEQVDGYVGSKSVDENGNVTFTNELKKVEIVKDWKDSVNESKRPNSLNVTISKGDFSTEIPLQSTPDIGVKTVTVDNKAFPMVIGVWQTTIYGMSVEDGYGFEEIVPNGYDLISKETDNVAGTITFTNALDILIIKASATGKHPLAGAIFEITNSDGAKYYAQSEAVDGGLHTWYTTYTDGTLSGVVLPEGTYTLKEKVAPVGYALSSDTWTIEMVGGKIVNVTDMPLVADQTPTTISGDSVYAINFLNKAVYELPSTGGFGIYVPMMSGVIMMMAAAFILMNNKRKEVL